MIAKTFLSKLFDRVKAYVPKKIRQALNIKDGDHIRWEISAETVRVYKAQITKA